MRGENNLNSTGYNSGVEQLRVTCCSFVERKNIKTALPSALFIYLSRGSRDAAFNPQLRQPEYVM